MITSLGCDRGWHDRCNGLVLAGGNLYEGGFSKGIRYLHASCECECHFKNGKDHHPARIMSGTGQMCRSMRVLVIDDMRDFGWGGWETYARTLEEGMEQLLDPQGWDEVWLDHDLGGDSTIRPLVLLLEEAAINGNHFPIGKIVICTDNSVGRDWIKAAIEKHYFHEIYRKAGQ